MNIAEIIKRIATEGISPAITLCTVTKVNRTARTVDAVSVVDDTPMLDVNLQAGQDSTLGVVQYPRVDSHVVVARMTEYESAVVILCEDVESIEVRCDSITLNGGSLGGLINIADLTTALNSLVSTFNSHTHPCPNGTTSAPTLQASTFKRSDYEDETITH